MVGRVLRVDVDEVVEAEEAETLETTEDTIARSTRMKDINGWHRQEKHSASNCLRLTHSSQEERPSQADNHPVDRNLRNEDIAGYVTTARISTWKELSAWSQIL